MANEWTNWKEHGITKDTPDSILFGAGTIHQGLTFSGDKWNFAESIIGATNGGSKVSMKPEVQDIEVDGKLIKAKGLMMKVGETATMEINFAEISPEIIKKGLIAQEGNSKATGYKVIESKPDIEAGDYFENFGIMFVGEIISAAIQIITIPWMFIWENCKEYITAAWEFIKNAVSTALESISNTISDIWNAIVGFISPILETLKNVFVTIWQAIETEVANSINRMVSIITTVWSAVSGTISAILSVIASIFSTVWNGITSVVSSVLSTIQSVVSSVLSAMRGVVSSVLNAILSTVKSIMNSIKSTMTSVWNGIKSVVSSAIN